MIALVQTAATVPVLVLALPAGALADVFDRRNVLLFAQLWMAASALALGLLTVAGLVRRFPLGAIGALNLDPSELFHDPADPALHVEQFVDPPWVAHLRHHERVTVADRDIQEHVRAFLAPGAHPVMEHLLACPPLTAANRRVRLGLEYALRLHCGVRGSVCAAFRM
jgi:hypothetical protein